METQNDTPVAATAADTDEHTFTQEYLYAFATQGEITNHIRTQAPGLDKERQAEVIAQYFRKGRPILVEGRLRLDQWDDKQTGQKRTKLRVVGESMQLLGGRPSGAGGETADEDRSAGSKATAPPKSAASAAPDDDEIPF